MKYRIKEKINNKNESTFIPQFTSPYFLFIWDNFGVNFNAFGEALDYIKFEIGKDIKKVKYHKIK